MDRDKEIKEISALKEAKLRPYTLNTFKRYWTYEDDYVDKKARVVNASYIVVYSVWHKRLLARVFYFYEYMKYKKISRYLFEVQRQVAGMSMKISRRLYNGTGVGIKVWTGTSSDEWCVNDAKSFQLYEIYSNWTGKTYINFEEYNDPIKYLHKSMHKYSAYELIPADKKEHNYMFEYLQKYEKHPQIEMLIKMGLPHIVDNLTGIRWSKKGIEMLGITKKELPYLKSGINLLPYRAIRDWCLKYNFTVEEAETAYKFYQSKKSKYKFSSVEFEFSSRMIRYLTKHKIDLHNYNDLIKAKTELGLPDEKRYLYPDDFQSMHDELNDRLEIKKSEELTRKIKERKKELKKYELRKNGLAIIALLSQDELIEEGRKLHHCVGGYADRVAAGETAIYSIRKSDIPDEPIATLELRGKQVIQVRAERNDIPPDYVIDFVKKWENKYHLQGY